MELLRDVLVFLAMMLGIVGRVIAGLLALALSPFVIGMIVICAVIFEPDMDGY